MGGGVGGPELAAAVRDAGGLGMVPAGEPVPEGCGVNFLAPFVKSPAVVADAARRSRVVEFLYARPDPALTACAHDEGAIVGWQAGSVAEAGVAEAAVAEAAGCDYIVAEGTEAGGHIRGTQPLDVILADVLERVTIPVVAAGGVATPERFAELLAAGADAVRVGTAFLVCPEARAHPDYVANLLAATAEDTVLTEWFDEGWPNVPHRVLRSALAAAEHNGWRSTKPPARDEPRPIPDMAQYAGTGVGAITAVRSATTVLCHLVSLVVARS